MMQTFQQTSNADK